MNIPNVISRPQKTSIYQRATRNRAENLYSSCDNDRGLENSGFICPDGDVSIGVTAHLMVLCLTAHSGSTLGLINIGLSTPRHYHKNRQFFVKPQ